MVVNVIHLRMLHVQTTQDFFSFVERPHPSYLVFKFGNILSINNWSYALTFQSYDAVNNTMTIKCPYPSYPLLKFGNVLPISS